MTLVMTLEPVTLWSLVKYSTTEPQHVLPALPYVISTKVSLIFGLGLFSNDAVSKIDNEAHDGLLMSII